MQENTYYSRHRDHALAISTAYYHKNRELINTRKRELRALTQPVDRPKRARPRRPFAPRTQYKPLILAHYGMFCACCAENNQRLLSVDHINDNGREHGTINNRFKGELLYRELIRLNYPDGIQILCFNCNIGKRNNGGVCPHKS